MQHRIGIVSEWKLPAFTSKSLISKSTFYSSCQQIFALQTKHLKWKVPLKIWFSHSDQTWGRRYSIVSYKAVSWHEGRWSLLYGRYLEIVQARHTQFHFCSYKHKLLSSNVFIPPLPLATQDSFHFGVLQSLLDTPRCLPSVCSILHVKAKLVTKAVQLNQ